MSSSLTNRRLASERIALALLAAFTLAACDRDGNETGPGMAPGNGMPPAPVAYVTVETRDFPVSAAYAGRLHGAREAEVRARVGGILEERLYEEGAVVEQGAPLFRIDRAPYRIALQRAEAEKANARAALNQAEREWRRVSGLYEQGAVSERERDRTQSELELAEAQFALAEAGVAQARLNLEYTVVSSPVAGVTSLETLTAGNLVDAGTLLTTVTQIDPVQVRFSIPEAAASSRRALAADGADELLAVELVFPDGSTYGEQGVLDFLASTVDRRTGSVTARASFPNPAHRLMPGTLARVHLTIEVLEGVAAIDPRAVAQGIAGPMVFVIDEENVAHARDVALGPILNGQQVVRDGLAAGDRVVVNGNVALRDGAPVNPVSGPRSR